MHTKLSLSQIQVIIKKLRKKKNIALQKQGAKLKLSREHLSWVRDVLDIEKFKRMTISELRAYFLERFQLPQNFITLSGLRRSLKKRIKLSWKKISLYKKKTNRGRFNNSKKGIRHKDNPSNGR